MSHCKLARKFRTPFLRRLRSRFDGRKRKHDAAEMMAQIVAKRLVEHLERPGFVVMKKPPIGGSAPPMTRLSSRGLSGSGRAGGAVRSV
jgi:hypothetical protein